MAALLDGLLRVAFDRCTPRVQESSSASVSGSVPGKFVDIAPAKGIHFLHRAPHTSKKYLIERWVQAWRSSIATTMVFWTYS